MSSPATYLSIDDVGPVRRLTLDDPERKNAVPPHGWAELLAAFADFDRSAARVLVISGAGDDFCSGANLALGRPEGGVTGPAHAAALVRQASDVALALHRIAKPTIAAVDGVAFGAGMNLAIGCDLVIATTRARFSQVFVRRGLVLDTGGTWLLPRLVGLARARELSLTGRVVSGEEAARIGLITDLVATEDLGDAVAAVAAQVAAGAPLAQRLIKAGLDRSFALTLEQTLEYETQAQAVALSSADAAEGIGAFFEKRTPEFRGR